MASNCARSYDYPQALTTCYSSYALITMVRNNKNAPPQKRRCSEGMSALRQPNGEEAL